MESKARHKTPICDGTVSSAPCVIDGEFVDQIVIPPTAVSHEGFRKWAVSDDFPDRADVSYIQGQIVADLRRSETLGHVAVKTDVGFTIANMISKRNAGVYYSRGALLTNVDAEFSHHPDGFYATWDSLRQRRFRLVESVVHPGEYYEAEGTPDWVFEIVSHSSGWRDRLLLREAYHAAGIPEYWLIDASGDEIDFQLLVHERSGYVPAEPESGWRRSPVFDRLVRLDRSRDRLGLWKYILRFKSD